MTNHYFENDLVKLHYYKFGHGPKPMLCFHGYGMHGKQFKVLEEYLGDTYTFYGFDLFFHKDTVLKNQDLKTIKTGISKQELASIFIEFCNSLGILKFSVLSYSMGSHYAATLVEEVPERISEFITAAPSSLKPGWMVTTLSRKTVGNKFLEKISLSNNGMLRLLKVTKTVRIIDEKVFTILAREIETYELRFAFYACFTYLKHLKLNPLKFVNQLNKHQIKSIFIFGSRDWNYSAKIGRQIIPKIHSAEILVIEENHDMINRNFAVQLTKKLHDN